MTKICRRCLVKKPIDQFSVSKQGVRGPIYRTDCKACCAERARAWGKSNPERHARTVFAYNLKTIYGMTIEEYEKMLFDQDGKCAICREPEKMRKSPNSTPFRMSVDHCHSGGQIRGLLCNRCNRALGLLGDDVNILRAAISYLEGCGSD